MVFNQLLWSIHSKVINRLQQGEECLDVTELAPCDIVPTDTKVFTEHFQEVLRKYSQLKDLLKVYCTSDTTMHLPDIHCKGFYLEAFYQGVCTVLENLVKVLYRIEKSYLCKSSVSMLQIYNEFAYLTNILSSLNAALEKLKEQKYNGCKILDLCESFINGESSDIREVFITIEQLILKRFYMQLKLWLIQTVLHDPHKEFFIKTSNNCLFAQHPEVTFNSLRIVGTDASNDFLSKKYEVNADNLPLLIPFSVAVKIVFIGECLIMCQHNEIDSDDKNQHLGRYGITAQDIVSRFFEIEKSKTFNIQVFSNFIDDLWVKVNSYIREISDEIGNVNKELILMWEMYLLGRDELFQEFLLKGGHFLNSDVTTVTANNLNFAFKDAVYYVYLTENCNLIDQFSFKLPNRRALKQGLTAWSVMFLDCKVKWPLRYLFTPDVINMYNKLFSFLLLLKKAQMDLTTACKGINTIHQHSLRMEFIEVKIHLLSIVSNLRNYCLTYVIANELHILLTNVRATTMFTDLQKSLLLFLTNISDSLFLSDKFQNSDEQIITETSENLETVSNKVNKCFTKIFELCWLFSEIIVGNVNENVISELAKLKTELYQILKLMFSLLHKIDKNLNHGHNDSILINTHLYNLVMCLDYNKFYHNKFKLDLGH